MRHRRHLLLATAAGAVTAVVTALTMTENADWVPFRQASWERAFAATLLSEDFEDGSATGWTRSGGSWTVVADGSQAYRQSSTSSEARAQVGQASWTDYAVQARVRPLAFNGTDRFAAVLARAQSMTSYYYLALRSSGRVELNKLAGGTTIRLATAALPVTAGTWYTVRLSVVGSSITGYVNGNQVASASDTSYPAGRAGLSTLYTSASFDDVVVETDTSTPPSSTPTSGPPTGPPLPAQTGLVGFAAVNALGQNGTTGGAGGPTVTVSTANDFLSAIATPGPLNIRVQGMISLPGPMHDVTSDKTIVGVGANSGISGAGLNIGLPVDDGITSPPANAVHNVIIRNLVFTGATDDSINVQMFSHHIWIDHNDLSDGYDGLVDVKRGSSYVTVSWNHTHHHTKNMLLGHDDDNGAQDIGNLKVSYHHNWYDNTPQRNPRVRFGEPVHIFNNYYLHNTDAGVACQANAGCLVEGNYFESVEEPVTNSYAGPAGRCVARNNVFAGTEPGQPDCSGSVQEASGYYSYPLDNAADVKAIVTAGAGTGKIGL